MIRESDRCDEGGNVHAHVGTGLDNVHGVLSSTRYCVWCGRHQAKPYGARRGTWRTYTLDLDVEHVDDGGWDA